jgi:hypothetical protein
VGRIPFDEPTRDLRLIDSTIKKMSDYTDSTVSAFLFYGGTGEAWLLASSRDALRRMNWSATLAGSDGCCDESAPSGILPAWDRGAPHLAVMAAPSLPQRDGSGLRGVLPGVVAREPAPRTPPALAIALAPEFCNASNHSMASLFDYGWIAGGAGFTGPASATPLTPAWQLAVLLPADLASGAPLGNSVEASRRRYWVQTGRDPAMLLWGTERWRSLNTLGAVVYGDPALRAVRSPSPPEALPAATTAAALPLIVEEPVVTAPDSASADTPASTEGPAPSNPWLRWLGVCALAVFCLALLAWLLTRQSLGGKRKAKQNR